MMNNPTEQVRKLARDAAAKRQAAAAKFAALHARKPLFRKTMRHNGRKLVVQVEWPGVLRTYDAATAELMSEGVPGAPHELASDD